MTNFKKAAKNAKLLCDTCLTNLCIKFQNVISMISFRGTSSPTKPRPGALPLDLTECFALRLTLWRLLSSLVFVQKFTFIFMKMHKNCWHQSCSFWLRYAPNHLSAAASPQTPLAKLTVLPRPLAGLEVGPSGKGKEGGQGKRREGRGGMEGSPGMPKSRVGKPTCFESVFAYGSGQLWVDYG